MTTTELREDAIHKINQLPAKKLKVAVEFLTFLEERSGDPDTDELLAIPGLLQDVHQAKQQIASGKGVNWREVRPDV